MLQSFANAQSLREELLEYKQSNEDVQDDFNFEWQQLNADSEMDIDTKISKHNTEEISYWFSWTFSFLTLHLNFISKTASIKKFSSLFLDDLLINELYNQNIK